MEAFKKEGIKFAFPTTTTYVTQEDGQPLQINLGGEAAIPEQTRAKLTKQ
ncbi:MAG: hypothetical protein ACE5K1_10660 [Acidiferrobacterales bacterium]